MQPSVTFIDISVELGPAMARWPGSAGFTRHESVGDDGVVNSRLDFDPHVGTHVDAPRHHLKAGGQVQDLDVATFVGPALVVDCNVARVISRDLLEHSVPAGSPPRLLLRTRNGQFFPEEAQFRTDFTALDESGAEWLVENDVDLVGIDYLSIQSMQSTNFVHRHLLDNDVVILECLDLRHVEPGLYDLIALPLAIGGAESSPVRAALAPPGTISVES